MSDMTLLPTDTGMGSSALAAAGGAFVGSWFGDLWGGNRRGYGDAGVAPTVVQQGVDTSLLMDSIHANGSAISASNIANLQGFASIQNTVNQSASGLNTAVLTGDMSIQNSIAQAASGLNTAVVSSGYQSQLATAALSREIAECCCSTKSAVLEEGARTRELIQNNLINQLQTDLCDAKSANAFLKSEVALGASQAAQTALLEQKITQAMATVIAHIPKS